MAEKEKPKHSSEYSRIEIAYHGKRTDARDRSSEDPVRHTLPRAALAAAAADSSTTDDDDNMSEKSKTSTLKKRSFRSKRSKSKEKDRRASREREIAATRRTSPPPPPPPAAMPTTVEMNFEVLRPSGVVVVVEKSAENSPAAKKRSLSFQFWRDQQLKKSEAKQAQMEAKKSGETRVKVTSLPKKSPKPESVVVVNTDSPKSEKKFGRSSSLSTLFSAFSRKRSTLKVESRKLSDDILVQSSPLSPEFHASIVQSSEEGLSSISPIQEVPDAAEARAEVPAAVSSQGDFISPTYSKNSLSSRSPLEAWRLYRQNNRQDPIPEIPATVPEMSNENSEADPASLNIVRAANEVHRPPDPEIPTPDYDQMSVASSNASSFMSARYFHNRATDSSMEDLRPHLQPHLYSRCLQKPESLTQS